MRYARPLLAVIILCLLATGLTAQPKPSTTTTIPKQDTAKSISPRTLADLAAILDAQVVFDSLTGYGLLSRSGVHVAYALDVPWVLWNWDEKISVPAPVDKGAGPVFEAGFVDAIRERFSAREKQAPEFLVAAILIDPGHGGKDTGAIGEHELPTGSIRLVEKDLNLRIAKDVYTALKARFPGKRILLTRSTDGFISLEERVEIANSATLPENQAIIYVSIHANASFNKAARGFEVWYLNPEYRRSVVDESRKEKLDEQILPIMNAMLEEEYTTESIFLAKMILSRLDRSIGKESPNRGLRAEEWFVVRNAKMPSVLIETGFVTSPEEAALLLDDSYLRRVVDALYSGISDFILYFEAQKGSTAP